MCDKCVELDRKIEHYERIAASITDQLTIDRFKMLIEECGPERSACILKAASVGLFIESGGLGRPGSLAMGLCRSLAIPAGAGFSGGCGNTMSAIQPPPQHGSPA
jgi:hypothetical protein